MKNRPNIYPEFSWDHVPLYMHIRKSAKFNQEEGLKDYFKWYGNKFNVDLI